MTLAAVWVLPNTEQTPNRIPKPIDEDMKFGGQSTAGAD